MIKKVLMVVTSVVVGVFLLATILLNTESGQSLLLKRGAMMVMKSVYQEQGDTLSIFVCGSSSPLPSDRAQGCIAVLTPEHFYIIDSGSGSTGNLVAGRLPMQRLQGVLLTHFHSDHIAEIYEINLMSWVMGRSDPLKIYGPEGINQVVAGINQTYNFDVGYRVEHHGAELLAPQNGRLEAKQVSLGVVIEADDFKVTAFAAAHSPVSPAVSYRIDYKNRSVVITGDTIVTDELRQATQDVDLLLSDALSLEIINTLADAAAEVGRTRNSKILRDITDYHADTASLIELSRTSNIKLTGFYHMVPVPSNIIMEKIYERDLPDNVLLTDDQMWFRLAANGQEVKVEQP